MPSVHCRWIHIALILFTGANLTNIFEQREAVIVTNVGNTMLGKL